MGLIISIILIDKEEPFIPLKYEINYTINGKYSDTEIKNIKMKLIS